LSREGVIRSGQKRKVCIKKKKISVEKKLPCGGGAERERSLRFFTTKAPPNDERKGKNDRISGRGTKKRSIPNEFG